jgi:proteasome lid subunit RPN8/RPN11
VADLDYASQFARLAVLAEAEPDREVCGFVTVAPDGAVQVVPVRNVVGDAEEGPQVAGDARRAYLVDPAAHLALSRRLRRHGARIAAVYHSHVDGSASLSASDVEQALCDGSPLHPGVDQIVIGMRAGKVQEIRVFEWRDGRFRSGPPLAPG